MPEKLCDLFHGHVVLGHVYGRGMAQHMRRNRFLDAGASGRSLQPALERAYWLASPFNYVATDRPGPSLAQCCLGSSEHWDDCTTLVRSIDRRLSQVNLLTLEIASIPCESTQCSRSRGSGVQQNAGEPHMRK